MKNTLLIFVLMLFSAIFLFSSCDVTVSDDNKYTDDLEGTRWSRRGEILVFDSDSSGALYYFDEVGFDEVTQYSFTYTFDSYNYTGKIIYDDFHNDFADDTESFEIESHFETNILTLLTDEGLLTYTEVDYRSIF